MRRLVLLVPVLWMVVSCAIPDEPPVGKLEIRVDPRIELLAVVQSLGAYQDNLGLLTRFDFAYRMEAAEHFAPFREHAAVTLFDQMSRHGFSYDAPPTAMLYLSDPPELAQRRPFPAGLEERAGGSRQLAEFVGLLRDFARETDFVSFFDANRETHARIENRVKQEVEGADSIATLEAYYGMRQHGYQIILAPLFHVGGYGPRVERADGTFELYNIAGPVGLDDGLPVFGSAEDIRHLALHEFGHSFVNPTTARFGEELSRYDSLFEPIAARMEAMAYGNWETCVNEHVVRAITTRMTYLREGQQAGDRAMQVERTRGFVYVPALTEKLARYEAERRNYPTFVDFYPEILGLFEELSSTDIVAELGLDRFGGTEVLEDGHYLKQGGVWRWAE